MDPRRVYVSYSHDSEQHKDRVLTLADRLREDSLDVQIDRFEFEITPRWKVQQIEDSDFVLVVCTSPYKRQFEGRDVHSGLGTAWEGKTIIQALSEGRPGFAIPIVFEESDKKHRPIILRDVAHYRLFDDYDALYGRITDQPKNRSDTLKH